MNFNSYFDYENNDITEVKMQDLCLLRSPEDPKQMQLLKEKTPARIGIGHCGARYPTVSYLRFRADQAAAADAVFAEVDSGLVRELGLFEVRTRCENKHMMLTRPDLGRLFDDETQKLISERCRHDVDVEIYVGDGLCAPSVGANVPDILPAVTKELEAEGVTVGTPFFVRYCRVNTARTIAPLLNSKLTCVLIGERPGLLTAESMSAYMAYNARPDMQESEYTVVSNISRHGIPPVEAAAHIAELMLEILKQKKSGVALKLP